MLRTLTLSQAAWKVEQVMAETFPNRPFIAAVFAKPTAGKYFLGMKGSQFGESESSSCASQKGSPKSDRKKGRSARRG